eukprot:11047794-Alexandrium_andersonii.AAC.1
MATGWSSGASEHEAPEQPVAQREGQKRWAYPRQRKGAAELRKRPSVGGLGSGARDRPRLRARRGHSDTCARPAAPG